MNRRAPLAAINITPLVDVLLVLVATLLLLAPQMVKVIPADLPEFSIEGQPRQQQSLLLVIDENGSLFVDEHPHSLEDVKARVQEGLTTIEIAASGAVSYQRIVDVVGALREKQPREIRLIVR